MIEPEFVEFCLDDLSVNAKKALTELQFEMIKADDVTMWMSCFLHAAAGVHQVTNKEVGHLMDFHLSLFMSALINSPDCPEKNDLIDSTIRLLNTNRPGVGGIQ